MQLGFCGSVPDSSTRTPLLQSWGWSAFVVAVPAGYVTRPPVPCVPHFWGRDPSTVWLCGLRRCGGGQPALVGLPAVRPRSVRVFSTRVGLPFQPFLVDRAGKSMLRSCRS